MAWDRTVTRRSGSRSRERSRARLARRASTSSLSRVLLALLEEELRASDEAFEVALRIWHDGGHRGGGPR